MTAIRLARTATGRNRIAIFSGSYRGHFDGVLGEAADGNDDPDARPIVSGVTPASVADVLVLRYGDFNSLRIIREHADELAAILVEPVQSRRPDFRPRDFLHELRAVTTELDIALVFDEMMTGFRIHPGGAQAWYGMRADLATYGKIAGSGLPLVSSPVRPVPGCHRRRPVGLWELVLSSGRNHFRCGDIQQEPIDDGRGARDARRNQAARAGFFRSG